VTFHPSCRHFLTSVQTLMCKLDRYVAMELIGPFALGVGLFSVLLVSLDLLYDLLRMISENGLPLTAAVKVFVYKLPAMIVFTFPMGMLLASILGMGRLAGDGELAAMKAGGIPFWRVMVPLLFVAVGVSVLTLAFNESLVPAADALALRTIATAGRQNTAKPLRYVFIKIPSEGPAQVLLYARELWPARNEMSNVDMYFYSNDRTSREVHAEHGTWDPVTGLWTLENVTGADYKPDGGKAAFSAEKTTQYQPGKTPAELAKSTRKKVKEMSIRELKSYLAGLSRGVQMLTGVQLSRKRREALYFLNLRFAGVFAALVFALIGAPLAVRPQRTSSSIGLGIAVVIIFAYYVFTQWMIVVAQDGPCPPWVCAWLPDILGVACGAILLLKKSR